MKEEEKEQRLRDILKELCGGPRTVKKPRKHNGEVQKSVIRYHGPYIDASGERHYLTRKWHCNDSKINNWNGCNVNYSFDEDEMNGTQLIKNLHWLGKSNKLMDLIGSIRDQDHDEVNDEIIGGVVKTKKKRAIIANQTIFTIGRSGKQFQK